MNTEEETVIRRILQPPCFGTLMRTKWDMEFTCVECFELDGCIRAFWKGRMKTELKDFAEGRPDYHIRIHRR